MPFVKCLLIICTLGALTACDDHHAVIDRPDIYYFEVVDSYGHSNVGYRSGGHGEYHQSLLIDHATADGYFELWWDVESFDDYSATIYINDYAGLLGAYQLEHTYCGYGLSCDDEGFAYCEYSSGRFSDAISCSAKDYQRPFIDVTDIFYAHPSELYLILETCNTETGYCSSDSQRVAFD